MVKVLFTLALLAGVALIPLLWFATRRYTARQRLMDEQAVADFRDTLPPSVLQLSSIESIMSATPAEPDLDEKWDRHWLNRELEDRAWLDADTADWATWLIERAEADETPVRRAYEEYAGAAVRACQQVIVKLGHSERSLKLDTAIQAAYDAIGDHEAPITPMSIVDTCSWSEREEAVLREAERIIDAAQAELVST